VVVTLGGQELELEQMEAMRMVWALWHSSQQSLFLSDWHSSQQSLFLSDDQQREKEL
jgi:hypothetical protein